MISNKFTSTFGISLYNIPDIFTNIIVPIYGQTFNFDFSDSITHQFSSVRATFRDSKI